jgi:hypothetical protein
MIRIVTRLVVAPRNRFAVMQNAKRLVEFFAKHGIASEGVFENFHECEVVHLWSAPSIAAYEQATSGLRADAAFREFAGAAAQLIESEKKEYWRAIG